MPEPNVDEPKPKLDAPGIPLLVELAIGVATVPTLMALVGATLAAKTVQDLGRWSEEMFRGDRLPLLNIPPSSPSDS